MNHREHPAAPSRRGVPGPGLGIVAMIEAVISSLVSARGLKSTTLANRVMRMRWLASFLEAQGIRLLDQVTPELVVSFIDSRRASGAKVRLSERHSRLASVRLLYKEARKLALATTDPARDIQLSPRAPTHARPLIDSELAACWAQAVQLDDLRPAVCLAEAEAAAWTSEMPHIRSSDLDLEAGTVRIHGGATTRPRLGRLTERGSAQLRRRVARIGPDEGSDPVLMGEGQWDDPDEGRAAATMALVGVLTGSAIGPGRQPQVDRLVGRDEGPCREGHG